MFSSPPLEWPRPSCPNWLQPILNTAPKMLVMRQQPFPQLIFLICLPESRRQGVSTRRLAYSISQTTTVGFSSFGLSSSGQYISPHPATSPRASHIITELPMAKPLAVYSFCWQAKGINSSTVSLRQGQSPNYVSPKKYILLFLSFGAAAGGRGIQLNRTIFSVLLVKPYWFQVYIQQTDFAQRQGQISTSISLHPSWMLMFSSQLQSPCQDRMKIPCSGLYLPLLGRSMRQRQHCFCKLILRKVISLMSLGGSGTRSGSTQIYSTLSSQSRISKGLSRGSSILTTIMSLNQSLSHSLNLLMIYVWFYWQKTFSGSMSYCATLISTSSLHLGLLRQSSRIDLNSSLKFERRSFIFQQDTCAILPAFYNYLLSKVEKALFLKIFNSQNYLAIFVSSSKGASKFLGKRYFSIYFYMEKQRRQMSNCLSLPKNREAQSQSSCGKDERISSMANYTTLYSSGTSLVGF